MRNSLLALIIFFGYGCKDQLVKARHIPATVKIGQSFEINVERRIYTVFFIEKKPAEIKFNLSEIEEKKIWEAYRNINLKVLTDDTLQDNCKLVPKIFAIVFFREEGIGKQVCIDSNCDDFKFSDQSKAKQIKKFVDVVIDVVRKKSEVKSAPKSDMLYL
jgi:hypothetical protein